MNVPARIQKSRKKRRRREKAFLKWEGKEQLPFVFGWALGKRNRSMHDVLRKEEKKKLPTTRALTNAIAGGKEDYLSHHSPPNVKEGGEGKSN